MDDSEIVRVFIQSKMPDILSGHQARIDKSLESSGQTLFLYLWNHLLFKHLVSKGMGGLRLTRWSIVIYVEMSADDILLQSKSITDLNTENEIPRPSQADDISGSTNNSTRCPFYP